MHTTFSMKRLLILLLLVCAGGAFSLAAQPIEQSQVAAKATVSQRQETGKKAADTQAQETGKKAVATQAQETGETPRDSNLETNTEINPAVASPHSAVDDAPFKYKPTEKISEDLSVSYPVDI